MGGTYIRPITTYTNLWYGKMKSQVETELDKAEARALETGEPTVLVFADLKSAKNYRTYISLARKKPANKEKWQMLTTKLTGPNEDTTWYLTVSLKQRPKGLIGVL